VAAEGFKVKRTGRQLFHSLQSIFVSKFNTGAPLFSFSSLFSFRSIRPMFTGKHSRPWLLLLRGPTNWLDLELAITTHPKSRKIAGAPCTTNLDINPSIQCFFFYYFSLFFLVRKHVFTCCVVRCRKNTRR
jgi:hypothetical protein